MREIYETREEYEMAMRSGIGNNYILPMESNEEVKVLQEKLDIAIQALRLYSNLRGDGTVSNYESVAKSALKEIKELDE